MSEEICTCHCHHNKEIKHSIPCCTRCHICKKRIGSKHWSAHMEKCDPKFAERHDKIRKSIRKLKGISDDE